MVRRMIIMLVLVGIAFGGIFGFQTFKARMIAKALDELKSTPQAVSTTTAKVEDWQPRLEAVGSLRAVNGADLALQISGIVKEIHFQSGDVVAAGAPLLDLVADDNIARLHALEATADLAKITYQRNKDLVSRQAASQSTLDTDTANLKSAQPRWRNNKRCWRSNPSTRPLRAGSESARSMSASSWPPAPPSSLFKRSIRYTRISTCRSRL